MESCSSNSTVIRCQWCRSNFSANLSCCSKLDTSFPGHLLVIEIVHNLLPPQCHNHHHHDCMFVTFHITLLKDTHPYVRTMVENRFCSGWGTAKNGKCDGKQLKTYREAWEERKRNCLHQTWQQLSRESLQSQTRPGLCMSAERKGLKGRAQAMDFTHPEKPTSIQELWAMPTRDLQSIQKLEDFASERQGTKYKL